MKVSVIICAYNYGRYLSTCLDSVLSQTYAPYEVIVIDDGSDDDTYDIARSYDEITYIRQRHAGKIEAFNKGISEASGEIICNLDADDYWNASKLEKVIAAFKQYSIGGVTHSGFLVNERGEVIARDNDVEQAKEPVLLSLCDVLKSCFIFTPLNYQRKPMGYGTTICVHRDAISDLFPIRATNDFLNVDLVLAVGAARRGLLYLPERLFSYRIHGANTWVCQMKVMERLRLDILLFQWLLGRISSTINDEEVGLMKNLILEREACLSMEGGKGPIIGAIKASILNLRLVGAGLVPHWKTVALPMACLLRWGAIRSHIRWFRKG